MKKTNFDIYLEEQLKDPDFAERFEKAGEGWDVAIQLAALREKTRCVIISAWTNRGKRTSIVVRRTPDGATLSSRTRAENPIGMLCSP